MKIESYYEATNLLRTKHWLEQILADYENAARLLRESKEDSVLGNSTFRLITCQREAVIDINPHRPVRCGGLLQGFEEAADGIRKELEEIDKEIAAL